MIDNRFNIYSDIDATVSFERDIELTGIMLFHSSEKERQQYYARASLWQLGYFEEQGIKKPLSRMGKLLSLCGGWKQMAEGGIRWKGSLDTLFATRLLKGMVTGLILHFMIIYSESLFQATERYMSLISHKDAEDYRNILLRYKPKISEIDIKNNLWPIFKNVSNLFAAMQFTSISSDTPYIKFDEFQDKNEPTLQGLSGFASSASFYLSKAHQRNILSEDDGWKIGVHRR